MRKTQEFLAKKVDSKLENHVINTFKDSRNNYVTRKIRMLIFYILTYYIVLLKYV